MRRHELEIALRSVADIRQKDPARAIRELLQILEQAERGQYHDIIVRAHLDLSDRYRAQNEMPQARAHAEQALAAVESVKDPALVARVQYSMGVVLTYIDPTSSQQHLERALALYRTLGGGSLQVGHTLNALGLLHACRGEFRIAFEYFTDCEEIYRSSGNPVLLGSVNECMGSALLKMHRFEEAFEAFDRARILFDTAADRTGMVTTRICMATALLGSGKNDQAIEVLYEARERDPNVHRDHLRAIDGNIACALEQNGELERALDVLVSVLGSTDPSAAANASLMEIRTMAMLLAALDHVDLARQWIEAGSSKLESAQPRQAAEYLHAHSRIEALLGNTSAAYELLKGATALNEMLVAEERKIIAFDPSSSKRTAQMGQIRAAFPSLGESECMACALFAAGSGTKEVAQIMNLSVRTIESIRFRVTKKLGLRSTRELDAVVRAVIMQ
ncbi:MAG: tetratricopeptide repeat protein [Bacteroidetes bacterium]|nr:tetratricopeptide repeat protein [Bacteroidota bacterium]